jgi:hypothetical protein
VDAVGVTKRGILCNLYSPDTSGIVVTLCGSLLPWVAVLGLRLKETAPRYGG